MTTFDDLCTDGNKADDLLENGQYPDALNAYTALIKRAESADALDSFLLAKTTLSLLLARVRLEDIQGAHKLWTAPKETLIGQGIHFLESGQTSVHDLMLYYMLSAHLSSMGTDRETALTGMNDTIARVARYAQKEAPDLIPTVIGNWRAHLEEIFECGLAQVPAEAARLHKSFASFIGPILVPAGISFPRPSRWQIDWDSTGSNANESSSATNTADAVEGPLETRADIESHMDQINALMGQKAFGPALEAVRVVKREMLQHTPCDPSLLGWVVFFEFKCLYSLEDFEGALAQADEALGIPFILTSNNSAYRASVCSELAVRCNRPVETIIKHAKVSFEERSRGGNPVYALQSLQTTCNLLELRDAEDQAEFFARKMIDLGLEHQTDVPVLKGFLMLMRGALRAGRDGDLRPLVDELLGALRPLDKSEKRADLMGQVSMLESTRSPLASNQAKLERFLAS